VVRKIYLTVIGTINSRLWNLESFGALGGLGTLLSWRCGPLGRLSALLGWCGGALGGLSTLRNVRSSGPLGGLSTLRDVWRSGALGRLSPLRDFWFSGALGRLGPLRNFWFRGTLGGLRAYLNCGRSGTLGGLGTFLEEHWRGSTFRGLGALCDCSHGPNHKVNFEKERVKIVGRTFGQGTLGGGERGHAPREAIRISIAVLDCCALDRSDEPQESGGGHKVH
jgi:hypothetical protein